MQSIASLFRQELGFSKSGALAAAMWAIVGVIATYLTTLSPEAQISTQAFCSLFSNFGAGIHSNMSAIGHCPYCYAAIAAFAASVYSLVKKA